LTAAAAAVAVPLAFQPQLAERDLRLRTHQGALGQVTLDTLLGLVPVRAHRAAVAMTRAHDELAAEWRRAALGFQRTAVIADGVQALVTAGLVAWLFSGFLPRADEPGKTLLFAYWALAIPVLGYDLALAARRWPPLRTVVLRLLEPLSAPEDEAPAPVSAASRPGGVDIVIDGVRVVAGGQEILHGVDLRIPAGSHVALVGASGAGKSSLLGLLLGWHAPAEGVVSVDGEPLRGARLAGLRAETAWVDPAVQLWNRSLAENVHYGASVDRPPLDQVVADAGLDRIIGGLPEGLDTPLGEGGGLVSGGEGQRVRLGRALTRPRARLVVLDEPFRGLERPVRARLLAEARERWQGTTLLCATHDVAETAAFDRVLVIEGGRIVEDGRPADLAEDPGSCYRALLDGEAQARALLFRGAGWRRWRLERGRVIEEVPR
jgi:ATP-binding cassette subfamily B protein